MEILALRSWRPSLRASTPSMTILPVGSASRKRAVTILDLPAPGKITHESCPGLFLSVIYLIVQRFQLSREDLCRNSAASIPLGLQNVTIVANFFLTNLINNFYLLSGIVDRHPQTEADHLKATLELAEKRKNFLKNPNS